MNIYDKHYEESHAKLLQRRRKLQIAEKWIYIALVIAIPTFLFPALVTLGIADWMLPGVEFSLVESSISTGCAIFFYIVYIGFRRLQGNIDQKICEIVFSAEVPQVNYALLLRSYFIDENLYTKSQVSILSKLGIGDVDSLQTRLSHALQSQNSEFVRIGDRREFLLPAASVISSDADWFSDHFIRLVEHATIVFLCPIVRKPFGGTMKEIAYLKTHGMLDKTILITPPRNSFNWFKIPGKPLVTTKRLWNGTRALIVKRFGLDWPKFPKKPAIFIYRKSKWHILHGLHGHYWDHPVAINALLFQNGKSRPLWQDMVYLTAYVLFASLSVLIVVMFVVGLLANFTNYAPPPVTAFFAHVLDNEKIIGAAGVAVTLIAGSIFLVRKVVLHGYTMTLALIGHAIAVVIVVGGLLSTAALSDYLRLSGIVRLSPATNIMLAAMPFLIAPGAALFLLDALKRKLNIGVDSFAWTRLWEKRHA